MLIITTDPTTGLGYRVEQTDPVIGRWIREADTLPGLLQVSEHAYNGHSYTVKREARCPSCEQFGEYKRAQQP